MLSQAIHLLNIFSLVIMVMSIFTTLVFGEATEPPPITTTTPRSVHFATTNLDLKRAIILVLIIFAFIVSPIFGIQMMAKRATRMLDLSKKLSKAAAGDSGDKKKSSDAGDDKKGGDHQSGKGTFSGSSTVISAASLPSNGAQDSPKSLDFGSAVLAIKSLKVAEEKEVLKKEVSLGLKTVSETKTKSQIKLKMNEFKTATLLLSSSLSPGNRKTKKEVKKLLPEAVEIKSKGKLVSISSESIKVKRQQPQKTKQELKVTSKEKLPLPTKIPIAVGKEFKTAKKVVGPKIALPKPYHPSPAVKITPIKIEEKQLTMDSLLDPLASIQHQSE